MWNEAAQTMPVDQLRALQLSRLKSLVELVYGRVEFYALRDIAIGEEITVDYGQTHHAGRLACRCGATGCRGSL